MFIRPGRDGQLSPHRPARRAPGPDHGDLRHHIVQQGRLRPEDAGGLHGARVLQNWGYQIPAEVQVSYHC